MHKHHIEPEAAGPGSQGDRAGRAALSIPGSSGGPAPRNGRTVCDGRRAADDSQGVPEYQFGAQKNAGEPDHQQFQRFPVQHGTHDQHRDA
ncbi:UNVERIFIED_CONTAM: hypothetical protein ACS92_07510 [Bacillus cereus]